MFWARILGIVLMLTIGAILLAVGGGVLIGFLVVDHLQRVEAEYDGQTLSEHLIDVAYELRTLAHELNVLNVIGAVFAAPPSLGIVSCRARPFFGRGDVFDRGVEPDIKDLVLEPGTD